MRAQTLSLSRRPSARPSCSTGAPQPVPRQWIMGGVGELWAVGEEIGADHGLQGEDSR